MESSGLPDKRQMIVQDSSQEMSLGGSFSPSASETGKCKYGLLPRGRVDSIILKKETKMRKAVNGEKSFRRLRDFVSKKFKNNINGP